MTRTAIPAGLAEGAVRTRRRAPGGWTICSRIWDRRMVTRAAIPLGAQGRTCCTLRDSADGRLVHAAGELGKHGPGAHHVDGAVAVDTGDHRRYQGETPLDGRVSRSEFVHAIAGGGGQPGRRIPAGGRPDRVGGRRPGRDEDGRLRRGRVPRSGYPTSTPSRRSSGWTTTRTATSPARNCWWRWRSSTAAPTRQRVGQLDVRVRVGGRFFGLSARANGRFRANFALSGRCWGCRCSS
jgi:hypothetical protein